MPRVERARRDSSVARGLIWYEWSDYEGSIALRILRGGEGGYYRYRSDGTLQTGL